MAMDQTELYLLLARMADGDQKAFSRFYDATINRTFGVIMKMTANRQLAEEVASDVYMQAWRTAEKYNAELAAPMTWLIMIARSRSIDTLRREASATKNQYPQTEGYDMPDDKAVDPFMETLNRQAATQLQELMTFLDDSERQMIILSFYQDMSHTEIAAHTGTPLGTVKTILRRAQAVLRSALKKTLVLSSMREAM